RRRTLSSSQLGEKPADRPLGRKTKSSAIGARLGQQNEDVEEPATDCGDGRSDIGPGGSSQNLLNSSYLLVAPDDTLAHQQFLRSRTSIEFYWQSNQSKHGRRPEEDDADPGERRKLQHHSCHKQPGGSLRS